MTWLTNEWLQWLVLLAAWLLALYGVASASQRRSLAASVGMAVLLVASEPTLLAVAALGVTAVPLGVLARRQRAASHRAAVVEVA